MADDRLRRLESEWKASGTLEAEVAYLQERIRAGELTRNQLRLAAYCRYEAACLALPKRPLAPEHVPKWAKGLKAWGEEAVVRAVLVLAPLLPRKNVPGVSYSYSEAGHDWLDRACTLMCGVLEGKHEAPELDVLFEEYLERFYVAPRTTHDHRLSTWAELRGYARSGWQDDGRGVLHRIALALRGYGRGDAVPWLHTITKNVLELTDADVRSLIERELVGWALASPE